MAKQRFFGNLAWFSGLALWATATSCMGVDEPAPGQQLSPLPHGAAVSLGAYNADIHQSSVSGISSGGYMAVQFGVAFSGVIKGVGVFAGGPYHCAGSSGGTSTALTTCMQGTPAVDLSSLITLTDHRATAGDVDSTDLLRSQKIWLFSGTNDTTVHRPVMDALNQYYQHYVSAANLVYKSDLNAAHAHVTDTYGNGCTTSSSPYINNCGYDGPGALLQHIYGPLNPRNTGTPTGQLIQFDQAEFIPSPASKSMDTTGWVYVPASCAKKEPCKVHIAFHGCEMSQAKIRDAYYAHAGYNQWADTNHLIVLYPQAVVSNFAPSNPKACFDWWGYNDPATYDTKRGAQIAPIKKMLDRLTSGAATFPAPTGLVVTATTDTSVSLAFDAVTGAVGYDVYRATGGAFTKVNASPIVTTTYTDSGLTAGTTYSYEVRAVTSAGSEGDASTPVSATTTGHPPMQPAPTNLTVTATTATTVALSYTASTGAAGYNVYRATSAGGTPSKANSTLIGGTTFTDSGLSAGTTYYYTAKAQSPSGMESAASNEVAATTAAAATCYTANNWAHYTAGRARFCEGFGFAACAVGSGQNLGLLNILTVTTLKQTRPSYYVLGTCP